MKILAIDDEQLGIEALESSIRKAEPESEIYCFREADDVLDFVASNAIDVAFLDIQLRGELGTKLAQKIKIINPSVNIIFATGFSQYQGDALSMHASGYIMKPITPEKVREELDNLRYPINAPSHNNVSKKLKIKTFGNFDVYSGGSPLKFKYEKTKELLAYLVDRQGSLCSNGEIMTALWEDDSHESYLRGLRKDLVDTLKTVKSESIIIVQRGRLGIDTALVDCDYYDFIDGKPYAINAYRGEYMIQYSWAELTNAAIYYRK